MKIKIKEKKKKMKEEAGEKIIDGIYHATHFSADRILVAAKYHQTVYIIDNKGMIQHRDKSDLEWYKNVREIKSLKLEYEV